MEPLIEYIQRKLQEAGSRRFAAIAREVGVSEWLLPKLANGNRDNPRIQTIQPLLDYFGEIERGERQLPPPDIDPRYLIQADKPVPSEKPRRPTLTLRDRKAA